MDPQIFEREQLMRLMMQRGVPLNAQSLPMLPTVRPGAPGQLACPPNAPYPLMLGNPGGPVPNPRSVDELLAINNLNFNPQPPSMRPSMSGTR